MRTVINIEKSCFEIFITVYLENAWCLVYVILHQLIQGELPPILDSFFTSATSDYVGVVGWEW